MRHYVGVSGVATQSQQENICEVVRNVGLNTFDHQLLLGVKATEKTQWFDQPNKYGAEWFPIGEDIRNSVSKVIDFDNLDSTAAIPYVEPAVQMFFGSLADDPIRSIEFTMRILDRTSGWVRYKHNASQTALATFQYDQFPWMEHGSNQYFEWLAETGRVCSVILQCHGEYMGRFHPYEVARRLNEILNLGYLSLTVLFDASHGTGKEIDPEALRPFLGGVLDSRCGDAVSLAVAGGLCGDNLEMAIPPLIEEFGLLSWDAEARLHFMDKVQNGGFDQAQLGRYLKASAEITRTYGFVEDYPEVTSED